MRAAQTLQMAAPHSTRGAPSGPLASLATVRIVQTSRLEQVQLCSRITFPELIFIQRVAPSGRCPSQQSHGLVGRTLVVSTCCRETSSGVSAHRNFRPPPREISCLMSHILMISSPLNTRPSVGRALGRAPRSSARGFRGRRRSKGELFDDELAGRLRVFFSLETAKSRHRHDQSRRAARRVADDSSRQLLRLPLVRAGSISRATWRALETTAPDTGDDNKSDVGFVSFPAAASVLRGQNLLCAAPTRCDAANLMGHSASFAY